MGAAKLKPSYMDYNESDLGYDHDPVESEKLQNLSLVFVNVKE